MNARTRWPGGRRSKKLTLPVAFASLPAIEVEISTRDHRFSPTDETALRVCRRGDAGSSLMASFEVAEPHTLDEALMLLDGGDPAVRPIGGGTALMLMMKAQLFQPRRLVSLRHLGEPFRGFGVSADGTTLRVGATTTFSELEHSALIRERFPIVAETMRTLANVRVRNVATVAGNIAHADPHLDLPPVWVALDAEVLLIGRQGRRVLPVEEIFLGYYETAIADGEVIAELRMPVRAGWRSTYVKVTTRSAHDWPALGIALSVALDHGRIDDLRVVLSAALDRPTRLMATEAVLRGSPVDEAVFARAAEAAADEAEIGSDSRGSASYKRHLLGVHLGRALRTLTR